MSQQAAKAPASAAASSAEQDALQCIYETDWQVTEPMAQSSSTVNSRHRGGMLLWASRQSQAQLVAPLHDRLATHGAAAATLTTVRQAQALQYVLSAPGAFLRCAEHAPWVTLTIRSVRLTERATKTCRPFWKYDVHVEPDVFCIILSLFLAYMSDLQEARPDWSRAARTARAAGRVALR